MSDITDQPRLAVTVAAPCLVSLARSRQRTSDEARTPSAQGRRPNDRVRRAAVPAVGMLAGSVSLAVSLMSYASLRMGEDLTLFTQAVKGYSRFSTPWAPGKADGFNLLGDHFHPAVALIGLAYRWWPDPRVLLVAQALLVAIAAAALTACALRHLRRGPALLLSIAFALSWPLQALSGYGFHEVAFAVPLLAASLSAVVDGRHRAAAAWALPLFLVKEDQALTVAMLGLVLAIKGSRRLGAMVAATGIAAFVLITAVVIPALSYYGRYTYWSVGTGEETRGADGAVAGMFRHVAAALGSPLPWITAVLLLLVVLGTAVRSPIVLMTLPAVGLRLASSNEGMWTWHYHYDATLVVILFFAALDGLILDSHLRRRQGAIAAAMLTTALVLLPFWPLGKAMTGRLAACPTCADASRVVRQVPDGADVAADVYLGPRLVARTTTRLLQAGITDSTGRPLPSRYAVLDARRRDASAPGDLLRRQLLDRGFELVDVSGPYELYRRP